MRRTLAGLALALALPSVLAAQTPAARITILSDAFGKDPALHKDWGFAALVEIGDRRILFDTGNDGEHLAANARRLGVSLAGIDTIVVSHRHGDHTDGLRRIAALNPGAPIYVPADENFGGATPPAFFTNADPSLPSPMRYFDGAVPERVPHGTSWDGANLVIVPAARAIAPGIALVANLSPGPLFTETPEISLVLETAGGRVLVVGCSHPGIERILESADARARPVRLLVGGLHLVTTPRGEVSRLAGALRDSWKLGGIAPGHCTGEHAFAELRKAFGDRYVYAGVGSVIDLAAVADPAR